MIMAHCFPHGLSNMFLRVQVWTAGWKEDDLQARIFLQNLINKLTAMPGSTIPKQNDGHIRIGFQNHLQVLCRNFGIHNMQSAWPALVRFSGSRCHRNVSWLALGQNVRLASDWSETKHGKSWPAGTTRLFIFCQKNCIWSFLCYIDKFFFRAVLQNQLPWSDCVT